MLLIRNNNTEPYINMACEEYLLMTVDEPVLMFWRNEPAVIIGKNQNAEEQVNFDFTKSNGIKVVRRLTGGGAVFHDLGNINYTFIMPSEDMSLNFSAFAEPIIKALEGLGIKSELSGRNDLTSDGRKFSGTAQCTYYYNGKKKLMHHGTLLFDADFSSLVGSLNVDEEKIKSKGIKSVKSRVVNLSSLLPEEHRAMTPTAFLSYLENHFIKAGAVPRELGGDDFTQIKKMADEKYSKDEWLFRARINPEGTLEKKAKKRFDYGTVEIAVFTKIPAVGRIKVISDISITGDFFGAADVAGLEHTLLGCEFSKSSFFARLSSLDVVKYIMGSTAEDICGLIFEV